MVADEALSASPVLSACEAETLLSAAGAAFSMMTVVVVLSSLLPMPIVQPISPQASSIPRRRRDATHEQHTLAHPNKKNVGFISLVCVLCGWAVYCQTVQRLSWSEECQECLDSLLRTRCEKFMIWHS